MSLGKTIVLDKDAISSIAKSGEMKDVLLGIANDVASRASARANESYTVTTVNGKNRKIVRVTGQEPPSSGYWRGRNVQALWHSKPRYGGKK